MTELHLVEEARRVVSARTVLKSAIANAEEKDADVSTASWSSASHVWTKAPPSSDSSRRIAWSGPSDQQAYEPSPHHPWMKGAKGLWDRRSHPFGYPRRGDGSRTSRAGTRPKALFAELLVEDYRIRQYVDKRLNRTPPFAAVSDIHHRADARRADGAREDGPSRPRDRPEGGGDRASDATTSMALTGRKVSGQDHRDQEPGRERPPDRRRRSPSS